MKSTISILLFFTLPFLICGGNVSEKFKKEVHHIDKLAEEGMEINGELLLKKCGFLGDGGFGFVYEGKIKRNNRSVAIKFVRNESNEVREAEFAMYCYLKAVRNESVEKYGIPCVYYYGQWKNYTLTALTKFDMNLFEVAYKVHAFGRNSLDVLILLRDFVYQSKYLHSHGVRHDDIKPENIMIRGHRSFLIDLNGSSKMMEDRRGVSDDYKCKRYDSGENRRAIDDYESFIYTISAVMRKKSWFKSTYDDNEIRKSRLGNNGTEKIIKAFADEVFNNGTAKQFPNYNYLEKMISNEIRTIYPNGEPKFSWIKTDAETCPTRDIRDIDEPEKIDFTTFVYPPVVQPSGSATQTSMLTRKRSSKKLLGCFSKQPCS